MREGRVFLARGLKMAGSMSRLKRYAEVRGSTRMANGCTHFLEPEKRKSWPVWTDSERDNDWKAGFA